MKPEEVLAKLKELIGEGNVEKAQTFMEDHKDDLGSYYEQAKQFLNEHSGDAEGILDKIKGLFK